MTIPAMAPPDSVDELGAVAELVLVWLVVASALVFVLVAEEVVDDAVLVELDGTISK